MLRSVQIARGVPVSKGTSVVYYDGACGMCAALAERLAKLDVFRRFTWVPFQSLEVPPAGLTWGNLDCAAYLRTRDGRLHEGFYAFRRIVMDIPLLLPLALLFWLPGASLVGVPLYRWAARNRKETSCKVRR